MSGAKPWVAHWGRASWQGRVHTGNRRGPHRPYCPCCRPGQGGPSGSSSLPPTRRKRGLPWPAWWGHTGRRGREGTNIQRGVVITRSVFTCMLSMDSPSLIARTLGSTPFRYELDHRSAAVFTWFYYQLIAKPGNATAAPPRPNPLYRSETNRHRPDDHISLSPTRHMLYAMTLVFCEHKV